MRSQHTLSCSGKLNVYFTHQIAFVCRSIEAAVSVSRTCHGLSGSSPRPASYFHLNTPFGQLDSQHFISIAILCSKTSFCRRNHCNLRPICFVQNLEVSTVFSLT